MIENSEPPASADTSRFNASVERGWEPILYRARNCRAATPARRPPLIKIFFNCQPPKPGPWTPQTAIHPGVGPPPPLGPHPLPMSTIESICVYCASGPGNNPAFMDAARKLGRILAENRIRLVYGGGSVGLMGALAGTVLRHGGARDRGAPALSLQRVLPP